jgi:hypothetical protein
VLDHSHHQAAGLLDLAIRPSPQLIAMVSHGDDAVELPLLLQICTALTRLGHSVTVLDGTVQETPDNPGLAQLCDNQIPPVTESDSPSWSVLPARLGLQTLSAANGAGLNALTSTGRLFAQDQVVVLYSTTPILAQLLHGSHIRPVLAVSAAGTSLLTSYLALKRLLLKGLLEPTIVNVVDNVQTGISAAPQRTPTSLNDCAKYFLNYEVNALNIAASSNEDRPSADIERLVLGLLENALALQGGWSSTARTYAPQIRNLYPAGAH